MRDCPGLSGWAQSSQGLLRGTGGVRVRTVIGQREAESDRDMLLILKMEDEAMSQGMQAAPRS